MAGAFEQLTSGAAAVRLTVDWSGNASATTIRAPACDGVVPARYKMIRSLKTVNQVWQEWSVGIHGGPAVRDLEQQHGSSWRNSAAEKRFFFRRMRIINRVVAIAKQQGIIHEQAVCVLEAQRTEQHLTLNALSEGQKPDS
jgi:hypothetical protein